MRHKLLLFLLAPLLLATSAFSGAGPRATQEQLSDYYPYALMSYLSETDIVLGCGTLEQQLFSVFRLSYLDDQGIRMVVDADDIPSSWRPHFAQVHQRDDHSAESRSSKCRSDNQLAYRITLPDSGISASVFVQKVGPASGGKIIFAFSGEQPNSFFNCLLSEPGASGACAPVKQQLQDIAELVSAFREEYPGYSVDVAGYSYSGALVQALMFASPLIDQAYIFNSYGVHPDWLDGRDDERQTSIHHVYIEGSLLHGQDYNVLSRYSRWRLPQHKVLASGVALSAGGLEPNLRQIYRMRHRDSWLNTLYNLMTAIWVLHSKEAVLRTFEAHLGLDFPW